MGHNRGWEEAASMFTGASVELKTCNAALLETTGKSWTEVGFHSLGSSIWLLYTNIFSKQLLCLYDEGPYWFKKTKIKIEKKKKQGSIWSKILFGVIPSLIFAAL